MKILHIIRGLANSSGTTHIVGPLAEAQAKQGNEVVIYTVKKVGEEAIIPDPDLVQTYVFPMTLPSRHYGWSKKYGSALKKNISLFDAVHVHAIWNYVTWSGMNEGFKQKVPYFVSPQGSLENWALRRKKVLKYIYGTRFERPLFNRASAIHALTEVEAEQCRNFGINTKIDVIPNGVDLNKIDSSPSPFNIKKHLGLSQNNRILLFLGRIFPKKGLDILIKGFSKASIENLCLCIAGSDAGSGYKKILEKMVRYYNIDKKVFFIGEVKGKRKYEVLKGADGFILSSYSEGLPVAVLEAMGSSLPVIITKDCNIQEVETFSAGWVIGANDEEVRNGIQEMFRSDIERKNRGNAARLLIEKKFTWSRIAAKTIELYSNNL